jgi:hypothetical protein
MVADKDAAKSTLVEYAGLTASEADKVVAAVLDAAEREVLELLAGDAPVPSSLTDARALRLRYITESLGRALRSREVEVILRVSPSLAVSSLRRLNATYPRAVDRYLKVVVSQTATVTRTGDAEKGYRYQIYFDDPAGLEYAYQLLQRQGLTHDVRVRRPDQLLDLPRSIGGRNPLAVLDLPEPK